MPLPNATDLGTFESATSKRLREMNEKIDRASAKRDRGFMLAVAAPSVTALLLAYVWTTSMALPAWERVNHQNQEIAHHGN